MNSNQSHSKAMISDGQIARCAGVILGSISKIQAARSLPIPPFMVESIVNDNISSLYVAMDYARRLGIRDQVLAHLKADDGYVESFERVEKIVELGLANEMHREMQGEPDDLSRAAVEIRRIFAKS